MAHVHTREKRRSAYCETVVRHLKKLTIDELSDISA